MLHKRIKILILLSLLAIIWGLFLFMYIHDVLPWQRTPVLEASIQDTTVVVSEPAVASEPVIVSEPVRDRCGTFFCYSSQEFLDIYNAFETNTGLPFFSKYIYNHTEVDDYIKTIAESLGYKKRIFADEHDLVAFENVMTRVEVRDAYKKMRDEMKTEGMLLHFVSGYRDSTSQRFLFKKKAALSDIEQIPTGIYDAEIYRTLETSAIPGYSKHHSGYAADFGCGSDYLVYTFADTDCYAWMSHNNFENTKRFGFIPSYPEGVANQGPNPEPWEFVWVGVENLL